MFVPALFDPASYHENGLREVTLTDLMAMSNSLRGISYPTGRKERHSVKKG